MTGSPERDAASRAAANGAGTSRGVRSAFAASMSVGALIHLLPLAGLAGRSALQRLYGVAIEDASLQLLLQHRALLFGLLGVLLLAAIRDAALRAPALIAGGVSCAGFVLLAAAGGPLNAAVMRVLLFDVAALLALGVATVLHLRDWHAGRAEKMPR